jgi:hypothetical protein
MIRPKIKKTKKLTMDHKRFNEQLAQHRAFRDSFAKVEDDVCREIFGETIAEAADRLRKEGLGDAKYSEGDVLVYTPGKHPDDTRPKRVQIKNITQTPRTWVYEVFSTSDPKYGARFSEELLGRLYKVEEQDREDMSDALRYMAGPRSRDEEKRVDQESRPEAEGPEDRGGGYEAPADGGRPGGYGGLAYKQFKSDDSLVASYRRSVGGPGSGIRRGTVGDSNMELEIRNKIVPLDVLGNLDIATEEPPQEVYLDGKRVPKGLEEIILAGLDALMHKQLDKPEEKRRKLHNDDLILERRLKKVLGSEVGDALAPHVSAIEADTALLDLETTLAEVLMLSKSDSLNTRGRHALEQKLDTAYGRADTLYKMLKHETAANAHVWSLRVSMGTACELLSEAEVNGTGTGHLHKTIAEDVEYFLKGVDDGVV